jgi:hypothetical protein
MRARRGAVAALLFGMLWLPAAAGAYQGGVVTTAAGVQYRTYFEDPGPDGTSQDTSLEGRAIALIDAVPPGERITFTFRDMNRNGPVNALSRAVDRGVAVDGVIDGQERPRVVVQNLLRKLGPDHFVICGTLEPLWYSCIARAPAFQPSLQHNKFMTFSKLTDGRENVVLQPSANWLTPSQFYAYNDMVEIAGDKRLYDAYTQYVFDLKAQVPSTDHYFVATGDDGMNTIFPAPRPQPDPFTNDTIAEQLDLIDCSEGGGAGGRGKIRIATLVFERERRVILDRLAELHRAGCDIEIVLTSADPDILAGLVSAGIPVHAFFRQKGDRPAATIVHDKFWIVDARNRVTGMRTKTVYAGSSNWRADEQYSDDVLLRIVNDGVYDHYAGYWSLIRERVVSDQAPNPDDAESPASVITATPAPGASGWNRTDVVLRIVASDGHGPAVSGLERLHVELSGAQNEQHDYLGESGGYALHTLTVDEEGLTTVTYFAEDRNGNAEPAHTLIVRVDRSGPTFAGLPTACTLWPPDHGIVQAARITASDPTSGLAEFAVSASSNAASDEGDVWTSFDPVTPSGADESLAIVQLRREKAERGARREYVVEAAATDIAGNARTGSGACVVPHSLGASG